MTDAAGAPGDLDRCAEIVERGDPDRFRALLAAPPAGGTATASPSRMPAISRNTSATPPAG